mgnify:CR=1 FL=1|tara:strand:+ start:2258 stop:2629 length:372 start_codon:yes stop_codon:yes gene_type:complete
MPNITFTLTHPLNQAIQPGTNDIAYYADTSSYPLANSNTIDFADTVVELGPIVAVNFPQKTITCDVPNSAVLPTSNDFVFFSKDNRANMASLLGYYAEVEVKNNSTEKAEIFAMGSEIFESSK